MSETSTTRDNAKPTFLECIGKRIKGMSNHYGYCFKEDKQDKDEYNLECERDLLDSQWVLKTSFSHLQSNTIRPYRKEH